MKMQSEKEFTYMDSLMYIAQVEFDLEFTYEQSIKLYDIYDAWQEQHNIDQDPCDQGDGSDHDLIAGYHFLANSRDYDNHKWLINKING
tara:strand:- start:15 stop:281 length:267 start_codon:yes stop_codon:yes gene_type:complete